MRVVRRELGSAVAAAWMAVASSASAQTGEQGAAADALYQDGKALLDRGEYAEACPKLAESHRLDAATGTVLALALCWERAGKIASAWSAYTEAATRARAGRDAARADVASRRAADLEPRLPRLRMLLGGGVSDRPGLEVLLDGVAMSAGIGVASPIDPGAHVIEVRAPGKRTERREITAAEGRTTEVVVDALEDAARQEAPVAQPPAPAEPSPSGGGLRTAGFVLGGVGVAALAGGAVVGLVALGEASTLKDELGYDADASTCPTATLQECTDAYGSATTLGTTSTVLFIAGGVLLGTGLGMIVVAGPTDRYAALELRPTIGGAAARGRF